MAARRQRDTRRKNRRLIRSLNFPARSDSVEKKKGNKTNRAGDQILAATHSLRIHGSGFTLSWGLTHEVFEIATDHRVIPDNSRASIGTASPNPIVRLCVANGVDLQCEPAVPQAVNRLFVLHVAATDAIDEHVGRTTEQRQHLNSESDDT